MSKKTVIDLFCGCGGLSQGFIDAEYEVILGIDHWKDAISTFNYNHENSHGIVADLHNESPETISSKTGITQAKEIRVERMREILDKYLLPHLGTDEKDRNAKAHNICKMLKKLYKPLCPCPSW